MKPKWWNKGKIYLLRRDKIMNKLLKSYTGHLTTRNNFFYSLTRSIISQQISVSAADVVFSRFEKKCKGKKKEKIQTKQQKGNNTYKMKPWEHLRPFSSGD